MYRLCLYQAICKVGKERKHLSLSSHGRSRVVMVCTDAAGTTIPYTFIYKGSSKNAMWNSEKTSQTLSAVMAIKTEGGGTTDDAFLFWVENVFLPSVSKDSLRGPKLLLLDNLACHRDVRALELLTAADVHVLHFPKNGWVIKRCFS